MRLTGAKAIRSLDGHGRPAISVCVKTENSEAWSQAHAGRNIDAVIGNFNVVSKKLKNFNFHKFEDLGQFEKFFNFNKTIAVAAEFAVLKAFSAERKKPLWKILNPNAKKLPQLLVNVAGRQLHGHADFDLHEILISPQAKNISDAVFAAAEIYGKARSMDLNGMPAETALEIIDKAASKGSCKINLGADIHASALCRNGKYLWKNFSERSKGICADEKKQIELVENLANRFDLSYVEDPLHKDAFKGFGGARIRLNKYANRILCGDYLTSTNIERLKTAIKLKSVSAVTINPLHAGSLIAAKNVLDFARKNGISTVFEAHDEIGAQLSHAWQASFVKVLPAGNAVNELMRI